MRSELIVGALLVGAGVFAALGIWFPKLRAQWKGTTIRIGRMTSAGFAFAFVSIGLVFLAWDAISEHSRIWFPVAFMVGFIAVIAGAAIERSSQKGLSLQPRSWPQLRAFLGNYRREIMFVLIALVMLFTMLMMFLRSTPAVRSQ
jgi:hypothetical protein